PACTFTLMGKVVDWDAVQRLLVMRTDNIGDVLLAGPALRALRERLPSAHVTLLASPAGSQAAPLLPWIDEVLTWRVLWQALTPPAQDPVAEWRLVEALRERHFDAAVILTSFRQSPWPPALVALLAGIPRRIGDS